MPIRFRCAYCNQLMGIARRKAGTVVRCPTCSGQVVVPDPDAVGVESSGPPDDQPLFERSDFDQLFDVPVPKDRPPATVPHAPAPPPPPAGAWGTHAEPAFDVERIEAGTPVSPAAPAGVVLTPGHITLLTVGGILLLAVVFGAGVLVGRILFGS